MTNFDSSLHPRGHASNAGAFSDKTQSKAEVALEPTKDWGTLTIAEGSRTPWGSADWVTKMAPGAVSVSTPGHGGVKLSKERNAVIPPALRRAWYEEDCEVNIVGMYHPEVFSGNTSQAEFEAGVKRWFPDEYEKATGNTVTAEESPARAEKLFAQAHENDFVAQRTGRTEETPGHVRLTAKKAATGETTDFLVPVADLKEQAANPALGQSYRIVIDEARHTRTTPKTEPVKVPVTLYTGVTEPKTEGARRLLAKDLQKRWRRDDGRVESLSEILARGVSGKSASVENGKRSYYLQEKQHEGQSAYSVLPVTKATFDAVEAPDDRSQHRIDYQDAQLAEDALDRAYSPAERRKLQEKVKAARAKADASFHFQAELDAAKAKANV